MGEQDQMKDIFTLARFCLTELPLTTVCHKIFDVGKWKGPPPAWSEKKVDLESLYD